MAKKLVTSRESTMIDEIYRRFRYGSEFGAHWRNENGNWDSEFKQYLETNRIRPILARMKHPHTNGKIEKWFDTYKRI